MTEQPVHLEVQINAPADLVWRALTRDMGKWWPRGFCIGPAKRFVLEPRVGGLMYEDWGARDEAVWGNVLIAQKNSRLVVASDIIRDFGGPGRHHVEYKITEKKGTTTLVVTDDPFGPASAESLKQMSEGWKYLIEQRLVPYLRGGLSGEPSVEVKAVAAKRKR